MVNCYARKHVSESRTEGKSHEHEGRDCSCITESPRGLGRRDGKMWCTDLRRCKNVICRNVRAVALAQMLQPTRTRTRTKPRFPRPHSCGSAAAGSAGPMCKLWSRLLLLQLSTRRYALSLRLSSSTTGIHVKTAIKKYRGIGTFTCHVKCPSWRDFENVALLLRLR